MPAILDKSLLDAQVRVDVEAAWHMARRLAREAGLFVGLSGGAAVTAALDVARRLDRTTLLAAFVSDSVLLVGLVAT